MKLKDISTIYNGNSINKKVKQEKYMLNVLGWNYISTKDIDFDGSVNYKNGVIIPFEEKSFKIAPLGTVFVCSEGGSAGKKTAYITEEVCFGNKLYAIVNSKNLYNGKYVYYYTRTREFLNQFKSLMSGIIGGVTLKNFGEITIPLPSIPEQERIVSRIEELFSELDKAVETLNTIKQQLAVYRQAVLKEAFIGEYPKDKLENVCFFITKGTTPKKTELMSEGEIPFIKVYNLTFDISLDFTIEPTFVSKEVHTGFLSRSIVYPGDMLMNIVGPPMGKVSIVPDIFSEWNINQAIVRFRCNENLYNKYLAYFLGFSETVEKMKSKAKATAGQFNLTLEICRNIEIPLPSIEIQKQIVNSIEVKLSVCDQIEKTIEQSLQQAEAMRQSILKQAFEERLI